MTTGNSDRPRTPDGRVWLAALMALLACFPCGAASRVTAGDAPHAVDETGSGHWMTGVPAPTARTEVAVAVPDGRQIRSTRTPAAHVGSVMAILATFHEAGVLPPESGSDADRLIHALIQSQSVFLNSPVPIVREFFVSAMSEKFGAKKAESLVHAFASTGWTSETLEALVDYSTPRSLEDEPQLAAVFHDAHVTTTDWKLIERVFTRARAQLLKQGKEVHAVFAAQRASMPGAPRHLPGARRPLP